MVVIKKTIDKNKIIITNLLVLMIAWSIYFSFFLSFYKEASFYVDKNEKIVVQLLFIMTYYLYESLLFLVCALILMTVHQLIMLYFFIKGRKELSSNRQVTFWMLTILLAGCVIGLLDNLMWPLFILVMIFSSTIVYITYAITKYIYEDDQTLYLHNEQIKTMGPYQSREEARIAADEFIEYWSDYFSEKGFELLSSLEQGTEGKYTVEIYLMSNKD